MEKYRVIITEVTNFGDDLRCVAGFDLDRKVMIRPEPTRAWFWRKELTGAAAALSPGNIVTFDAGLPKPPTEYPHLTEDRVVAGDVKQAGTLDDTRFGKLLVKIGVPLDAIFGAHVIVSNGKGYIPVGTDCPSLYGATVEPEAVRFFDGIKKGKTTPRMILTTPIGEIEMGVTASDIHEIHKQGGTAAIQRAFAGSDRLTLRIGLARGFSAMPDRCYFQANGIFKGSN